MVKRFFKKNWFGLSVLIVSIFFLIYFMFFSNKAKEAISAMQHISLPWIMVSAACMLIYWLMDGLVLFIFTRIKYKQFNICIDEVKRLGQFIEIEIVTHEQDKTDYYEKEIIKISQELGINTDNRINSFYDNMIHELNMKGQ